MNLAETLRGLLRRWYITFPGVILAIAVALGAWFVVPPSYVRNSTQLLLPGKENIPADTNPLLYLGGLSFAADVLVRAVGAENNLSAIKKEHPNLEVEVTRDNSSGGPFILITVMAPTNAEAGEAMDTLVGQTSSVLASLQEGQKIAANNRITVVSVAVDNKSTLQQRNRLVATTGSGVAILALALFLAGFVDGLGRRRRLGPDELEGSPDSGGSDSGDVATDSSGQIAPRGRFARAIRRQRPAMTVELGEEHSSPVRRSP